jgi:hypothetical protein
MLGMANVRGHYYERAASATVFCRHFDRREQAASTIVSACLFLKASAPVNPRPVGMPYNAGIESFVRTFKSAT